MNPKAFAGNTPIFRKNMKNICPEHNLTCVDSRGKQKLISGIKYLGKIKILKEGPNLKKWEENSG